MSNLSLENPKYYWGVGYGFNHQVQYNNLAVSLVWGNRHIEFEVKQSQYGDLCYCSYEFVEREYKYFRGIRPVMSEPARAGIWFRLKDIYFVAEQYTEDWRLLNYQAQYSTLSNSTGLSETINSQSILEAVQKLSDLTKQQEPNVKKEKSKFQENVRRLFWERRKKNKSFKLDINL